MSLPSSPLRLLPTEATFVGWDSHPPKICAFSRRTFNGLLSTVSSDGANAASLRSAAAETEWLHSPPQNHPRNGP